MTITTTRTPKQHISHNIQRLIWMMMMITMMGWVKMFFFHQLWSLSVELCGHFVSLSVPNRSPTQLRKTNIVFPHLDIYRNHHHDPFNSSSSSQTRPKKKTIDLIPTFPYPGYHYIVTYFDLYNPYRIQHQNINSINSSSPSFISVHPPFSPSSLSPSSLPFNIYAHIQLVTQTPCVE